MSTSRTTAFDLLRARIESGFARWGEICHDHPWWIIGTIVVALVYFSTWLPTMEVDTSNESYLRANDPNRLIYDAFQREFGKDERIVLVVESDGDILNERFLRHLQSWHEAIESIPQVDKVDSLINARLTLGRGDELIVKDLLEDWPQTPSDYAALRERIRSNPLYRDHFVDRSLTRTMILLTPDSYTASATGADGSTSIDELDLEAAFDDLALGADETATRAGPAEEAALISDEEIYRILAEVKRLKAEFERPDFQIETAGSLFMMHELAFVMGRDMFLFSAVGVLVIAVLLFLVFRRWVMVFLPICVSLLSVYLTFALMCFFGMVVTTSVQVLPSLLLAIGVGNSVHIFTVYFQAVDRGEDKRAALRYALGHSGLAVTMTGLTTAGGLVSFITANLKPVADMGITSPMGILCALVFSLTLLPALIAITPFKDKGLQDDAQGLLQRFLTWCTEVSTRRPVLVSAVWLVLVAVCLIQAAQLKPSHFPVSWFPVGSDLRDGTEAIDQHFGGGTFTEIVIDTGKHNGLHDPDLLQAADRAVQFLDQLEVNGIRAGKSTSLLDINKELHQALNGNDPAYYRIPDDQALIAQELLLFENSGSDDLDDIVDSDFSKMRITVKMPSVDGVHYPAYLDQMTGGIAEIIGDRAALTFTGVITILAGSVEVLISDTIRAYALALVIIAPLMMLLVGSLRIGLISMVPNLAPIIITLALMSILDIPLDAFTLLIGCIALGLAVDDTIHFMHNFQRYYSQLGNAHDAVRETLRTTGKALMITSLVLSSAFFVNMLGTMHNLKAFGLLTGFCIIMAFLADVLLAPALMTLVCRWKEKEKFA